MKVFFDLACMSTCCWGLPKPKYEPFITHNRGTLNFVVELDFYTKLNAFNSDRLSQTKCTKNTWHGIKLWLLTFLWGQNKLPEIVSLCFLCLKEWQEPEGGRSLTQDILTFHNPSFLEDRTLLLYCLVVCKATSNNWMFQELFKNKTPLICISDHSSGYKSQFWID